MDWRVELQHSMHLHRRGDLARAIDGYRAVLDREPAQFDALRLLGAALVAAAQTEAGLDAFDRALAIRADVAEVWALRGDALAQVGDAARSAASYERALSLDPARPLTWNSHGLQMSALGHAEAACVSYARALQLTPGNPLIGFNLALSELALGRYRTGWAGFELRQSLPALATPFQAPGPIWQLGEPIDGRRVLIVCEQGIGDTIQFSRFLPELVACGAQVLVNRPPPLRGLIETVGEGIDWLDDGAPLPVFDLQCGLLSLAHRLQIDADSIPTNVPYLHVDAQMLADWRKRLGSARRPRIGIFCSGNPKHGNDRRRSIPLREFALLKDLDVELHLLQTEIRPEDAPWLTSLEVADHRASLRSFLDTAALVGCMDAVVSVDTAGAHLAGALGAPLWILLAAGADWRWLDGRSDSPWYPTARLFRQPNGGNWRPVLEAVASDLRRAGVAS